MADGTCVGDDWLSAMMPFWSENMGGIMG